MRKPFPVYPEPDVESVESAESIELDSFETSTDRNFSIGTVKFMVIGLVFLIASSALVAFCIYKQSKTKDTTANHDEVEFVEL